MSEKFGTVFGGTDFRAFLNGEIMDDVQGVKFHEVFHPHNCKAVSGHVDVAIFESDNFNQKLTHTGDTFYIHAASEYGHTLNVEFENVEFTHREGGIHIDDVVMTERYYFTADKVKYDRGFKQKEETISE